MAQARGRVLLCEQLLDVEREAVAGDPGRHAAVQHRDHDAVARVEKACHSTESSLVRNATCHTAAPGRLTVGTPMSAARRLYSASSHLRNRGSTNPSRRTTSSGNWHIHQPL